MKQQTNAPEKAVKHSDKGTKLPCRGCTRSCSDFNKCNGRPWRLIK